MIAFVKREFLRYSQTWSISIDVLTLPASVWVLDAEECVWSNRRSVLLLASALILNCKHHQTMCFIVENTMQLLRQFLVQHKHANASAQSINISTF